MRPLTQKIKHQDRQEGATLLVAIMMLLIITLLALSSMRGVSLESRITGNLKQQRNLNSAAEAGLRIGEKSIQDWLCSASSPLKPCKPTMTSLYPTPTVNIDTPADFTSSNAPYLNAVNSGYNVKIQWYVQPLGLLQKPTMGNCALMASTINCSGRKTYYEITACASTVLCTADTVTQRVILRTVVGVTD